MANLSNINNILRTGSLGVGINRDPASPFEVSSATKPGIKMFNTATNGKTYQAYSDENGNYIIYDEDADSNRLIISGSGNATFAGKILVGVGTTAAASINAFSTTVSTGLHSALRIISQPSASNYWDIGATGGASTLLNFYHNGSTTPKISFTHTGGATFAGNVGIGTDSPSSLLHLKKATLPRIALTKTGILDWFIGNPSQGTSNNFTIGTNSGSNTEILTITNTGNVGIGITPNASYSGVEVLQLGKGMTLMGNTNDDRAAMMANLYLDSNTAFRYVMDGLAGKVAIEDGIITFGTAPSGTAGAVATVTERMRIESDGIISIGEGATQSWINNKVQITTTAVSGVNLTNIDRTAANLIRFTNPQYSTTAQVGLLLKVFPNSDARQGAGLLMTGGSDNSSSNLSLFVSKDDGTSSNVSQSYSALHIAGNTGNVGIGTTSPEAKLDISNVAGATYALEISTPERNRALFYYNSSSTSDAGYLGIKRGSVDALNHRFATTGNSAVCIGEGNFGIGTDSPASKFEVYGGNSGVNDVDRYIRFKASNGEKRFDFYVGGTGNASSLGMYTSDGTTKNVQIAAGGTSYFNGGNVGIGTTSPYKKLEVAGDLQLDADNANIWIKSGVTGKNGFINWTFNSDTTVYIKTGIDYDTRASLGYHIDSGYPITIDCTNQIDFKRSGSVLGRWNSSGLGIGTTSPSAKLEIVTAVGADAIRMNYGQSADIFLGFSSANPRILLQDNSNIVTHNFVSNGDNYIVGSNVGIGTTSPRASLEVAGELIAKDIKHSNFAVASLSTTGYVIATVTGGSNGASAQIEFVGIGGTDGIVDVVYSCTNQGGNWYATARPRQTAVKVDVVVSGTGTGTLTFTFKSLSSTQGYTPRVIMKGSPPVLVTF